MTLTSTQVRRFAALYAGYTKAYGTYQIQRTDENGKQVGKPLTIHQPVVPLLYERHLKGEGPGLGIIPLQEDDCACFGAIDYDNRHMDHAKAEQLVHDNHLPLVLCRSKSGGGHFYCFLEEPVPARLLREKLAEWAAVLGMSPKTELFPRQVSRAGDIDVGTYINLPYYQAGNTQRYAVLNGQQASLSEFLDYAETHKTTLERVQAETEVSSELFEEGPPCLQILESQGVLPNGTRNKGMFNILVYLKKRYPDDWKTRADKYNDLMAQLGSAELQETIKHVSKKAYSYMCKESPIAEHCQRRRCMQRLYGIGEAGGAENVGHQLGNITRYDSGGRMKEPIWAVEVDGTRVLVNTAQLYSKDEFNRACLAQANRIAVFMSPARWLKTLAQIVPTADIVETPAEASKSGQLWELALQFLFGKELSEDREQVHIGNPFREREHVYFRAYDLYRWLDAHRFSYPSQQWVYQEIQEHGAEHHPMNIKNKFTNLWRIPMPDMLLQPQANGNGTAPTEEF